MSTYLGRKRDDPDYGQGEHSIDADALGLLTEDQLNERLLETFSSPSYRPPRLPTVAVELMSVSQRQDVELSEIETLLEQDSMLAGEVLAIAGSAFYARSRTVETMREALVLLGLDKLRQVVMQAALDMRVFRSEAYEGCMERLRVHAHAVGHLSRIVAQYTPMSEERAFLCGLLHDVGFAGILLALGDVRRDQKAPDIALHWSAIDGAHAHAGGQMISHWKLPADVGLSAQAHHRVVIDRFPHPPSAIVCVAESLADEFGLALIPPEGPAQAALGACGLVEHGHVDRTDPLVLQTAAQALNLDDRVMELIRAAAGQWAADHAL